MATPAMERSEPGVVVPMPTLPVLRMLKSVVVAEAVEEPMAKSVELMVLALLFACIESVAYGEVEPMPTPVVATVVFEGNVASVPASIRTFAVVGDTPDVPLSTRVPDVPAPPVILGVVMVPEKSGEAERTTLPVPVTPEEMAP